MRTSIHIQSKTNLRASNVNCHAQAILSNYFLRKLIARPARSAVVSVGTNAAEPQNPRYPNTKQALSNK